MVAAHPNIPPLDVMKEVEDIEKALLNGAPDTHGLQNDGNGGHGSKNMDINTSNVNRGEDKVLRTIGCSTVKPRRASVTTQTSAADTGTVPLALPGGPAGRPEQAVAPLPALAHRAPPEG